MQKTPVMVWHGSLAFVEEATSLPVVLGVFLDSFWRLSLWHLDFLVAVDNALLLIPYCLDWVFTFSAVQPNKVYIGGLPEHTRQEDLQNCFGKIGNIVNIELKYVFTLPRHSR